MNLVIGPWQEKMTEKADTNVTIDDVLEDEDVVYLEVVGVGGLVVASHRLALVLRFTCILILVLAPGSFLYNLRLF